MRRFAAAAVLAVSLVIGNPAAFALPVRVEFSGTITSLGSSVPPSISMGNLQVLGGAFTGSLVIDTDLLVPTTLGPVYSLPPGAATLSLVVGQVYVGLPFQTDWVLSGSVERLQWDGTNWMVTTGQLTGMFSPGGPVRAELWFRDDSGTAAVNQFVPASLTGWGFSRLDSEFCSCGSASYFGYLPVSSGALSQWDVSPVPEAGNLALVGAGLFVLALRRKLQRW